MPKTVKVRMIEAAECLFAQRGISAVSLREIRAATGQRNTAAVHYHFGSKQKLVEAILEYRRQRQNEQRLAMLAEIERGGRLGDLRALVEADFFPFSDSLKRGSYYARFLAQAQSDPARRRAVFDYSLDAQEGVRLVDARLQTALHELPAAVRDHRLRSAGLMWIQAMARHERDLESPGGPAMPTAALAADLVDMTVAMLSVPVSPATQRLMRRRTPASADGREGSSGHGASVRRLRDDSQRRAAVDGRRRKASKRLVGRRDEGQTTQLREPGDCGSRKVGDR